MSSRIWLALLLVLSLACTQWTMADGVSASSPVVKVDGKAFRIKLVQVSLQRYRVQVGLAQGRVGATQALAGIARQCGAAAAINGCFFDAYTRDAIKPPYHNLVTGGEVVHLGGVGTTLGFDADGNYRMERVTYRLQGGTDDRWTHPNNWYAYCMNHPAAMTNVALLYTRHWAGAKTPAKGMQVVVQDGVVQQVDAGGFAIPRDGYVLLFAGGEQGLAGRFAVGKRVAYRTAVEAETPDFWAGAREALGCGPRLVTAGKITVDPAAEGFSHAKILTMTCARSAVGITPDGRLLMVTTGAATIRQLAGIMKALGAHDAMNLDGGASSSLWVGGKYLATPGRDISNALVVVRK